MASHAAEDRAPNIVNSSVGRTHGCGPEIRPLWPPRRHILITYRHGLRASEVCDLQWHQVELGAGRLHVRRTKRGTPSAHPMQGDEISPDRFRDDFWRT